MRELKRTWVVIVGMDTGHEYADSIGFSDFYGPYTQEEAERLEAELEKLFIAEHVSIADDADRCERRKADSMPLEFLGPRKLLNKYKLETEDDDDD